jgi:hypothetical protein
MRTRLVPFLFVFAACVTAADDDSNCTGGKCDADQSCSDPRYGDGTCNLDLSCSVPDIDCFTIFDNDAAAATWFTGVEQVWAQQENRAPRPTLPESDPRFQKVRDLLDRGWEAFRQHRPVGYQLSAKRPALVLLDSTEVNAFVMPDQVNMKSAFSVQVETGLLAGNADDAAQLGVMMHELEHAVALQLIGDRRTQWRKFYAVDNYEPIGREQSNDVRVSMPGIQWRAAADQISFLSNEELGGFPFAGEMGQLFKTLMMVGMQNDPSACANAQTLVTSLTNDIRASIDLLDRSAHYDASSMPARVQAALSAARDECLAGAPSYIDTMAQLSGQTAEQFAAGLTPHDLELVQNQNVIDGIAALAADRRAVMRAAEQSFGAAIGQPWANLRFYSVEEDADDTSVDVLRAAGMDPASEGRVLKFIYPTDVADRCAAMIAAGTIPPYGVDLTDEHHATCWRIFNLNRMAASGDTGSRVAPAPRQPIAVEVVGPLGLPDRIADHVLY